LYRWWSRLLRPRTCFIGTTVSEYALFPAQTDADALVREWLADHAAQPFLIVKDIPQDSPLLGAASNAQAQAIADAATRAGFVLLEGQALAWVPIDFDRPTNTCRACRPRAARTSVENCVHAMC
jgi:hypothetical protein